MRPSAALPSPNCRLACIALLFLSLQGVDPPGDAGGDYFVLSLHPCGRQVAPLSRLSEIVPGGRRGGAGGGSGRRGNLECPTDRGDRFFGGKGSHGMGGAGGITVAGRPGLLYSLAFQHSFNHLRHMCMDRDTAFAPPH